MKNYLLLFFFLISIPVAIAGTYSGGSGTMSDPYLIANEADLNELSTTTADWVAGLYSRQTADITMANPLAAPIGTYLGAKFEGVYDGDNHTISDLSMTLTGYGNALFGRTLATAEIKNLGLVNVSISGNLFVAGLVGYNQGTVTNCYVDGGTITAAGSGAGGLIGTGAAGSSVSNCYATANVNGISSVGGFIGANSGDVDQCFSTGDVTGTYSGSSIAVGSFIGAISASSGNPLTISDCFSLGNADANNTKSDGPGDVRCGGFIGSLTATSAAATITNCYSAGVPTGTSAYGAATVQLGGFIGYTASGSTLNTNNCFWDADASMASTSYGNSETGETTANMQTQGTFTGWDFTNVWTINNSVFPNVDYPVFAPATLGLNEIDNTDDFVMSLYPNPVTNNLNIKTNKVVSSINIYSLTGAKVMTIAPLNNTIDVSSLSVGIYILKVEFGDTSESAVKFVKQ